MLNCILLYCKACVDKLMAWFVVQKVMWYHQSPLERASWPVCLGQKDAVGIEHRLSAYAKSVVIGWPQVGCTSQFIYRAQLEEASISLPRGLWEVTEGQM